MNYAYIIRAKLVMPDVIFLNHILARPTTFQGSFYI